MKYLKLFMVRLRSELLQIRSKIEQYFERVDLQNKIADASCPDNEIESLVIAYCRKYDPEISQSATNNLITQLVVTRPELYNTLMCGK